MNFTVSVYGRREALQTLMFGHQQLKDILTINRGKDFLTVKKLTQGQVLGLVFHVFRHRGLTMKM